MIKFKKLHEDAIVPCLGSEQAAGLDLFIIEPADIKPNQRALLHTGIAMSIPNGFVGLIWPRSKLAAKKGVVVLAGVIDSDYRGEIMVSLLNTGNDIVELRSGDKVAQLIIQAHYSGLEIVTVNSLDETNRGNAGVNCTEMRLK